MQALRTPHVCAHASTTGNALIQARILKYLDGAAVAVFSSEMPDYLIVVVSAWAIVQLPLALALGAILRRASERQQVAYHPAREWRNAA